MPLGPGGSWKDPGRVLEGYRKGTGSVQEGSGKGLVKVRTRKGLVWEGLGRVLGGF